jgi:rod shape-determining protein MreD
LVFILIAAIIQVSFLDSFKVFGAKPNLLLICVFICATSFDWIVALFFSLFCGMVFDLLSLHAFGINTFLFPFWSLLLTNLSKRITLTEYFWINSLVLFLLTILHSVAIRIFFLSSGILFPFLTFLRIAILDSFYTALILALVLRFSQPLLTKIK